MGKNIVISIELIFVLGKINFSVCFAGRRLEMFCFVFFFVVFLYDVRDLRSMFLESFRFLVNDVVFRTLDGIVGYG